MKFRIKYADQIVGVFVIIAFVMLMLIIIAIGGRQRWFSRDYKYKSSFTSSTGLNVGTSILYKGFQIGRINQVSLNQLNNVDISFVIFEEYIDRMREHSILELVISPIGLGNQLLFYPGKSERPLAEGSFIPSLDSEEGKKLVTQGLVERPPKDDSISSIISNVNPLLENVNTTILQLEKLLGQVNEILYVAQPQVNHMMVDMEEALPEILAMVESSLTSVAQLAQSAAEIGGNLKTTSEVLRDPTGLVPRLLDPKGSLKTLLDDGDRLFNRVDNSLAQVEQALTNLSGSTDVLTSQMPQITATLSEARTAIVSAQDVMEGLKNNPLLKGGIPERINPEAAPTGLRTRDF